MLSVTVPARAASVVTVPARAALTVAVPARAVQVVTVPAPGADEPAPEPEPEAQPFSPADLTDLLLWFDAADTDTLTLDGTSVTSWEDKAQGLLAESPAASAPDWSATSFDGGPGVTSAIDKGLVLSDSIKADSDPWVMVLAIDIPATFSHRSTLIDVQWGRMVIGSSSSSSSWMMFGGSPNTSGGWQTGPAIVTGPQVLTIVSGASTTEIGANGAARTSLPIPSNIALTGQIGLFAFFTGSAHGIAATTRLWTAATNPTAEHIQKLEGYAAHTAGIASSLDADHPYKTTAP